MTYNFSNLSGWRLSGITIIHDFSDNKTSCHRISGSPLRNENVISNLLVIRNNKTVAIILLVYSYQFCNISRQNANYTRLLLRTRNTVRYADQHLVSMKCIQAVMRRYEKLLFISIYFHKAETSSGTAVYSCQNTLWWKHVFLIFCFNNFDLITE